MSNVLEFTYKIKSQNTSTIKKNCVLRKTRVLIFFYYYYYYFVFVSYKMSDKVKLTKHLH